MKELTVKVNQPNCKGLVEVLCQSKETGIRHQLKPVLGQSDSRVMNRPQVGSIKTINISPEGQIITATIAISDKWEYLLTGVKEENISVAPTVMTVYSPTDESTEAVGVANWWLSINKGE